MSFILLIIAVLLPYSAIFSSDGSNRYKGQPANTSSYDSLIFGDSKPYFSSEQVKATSDTHICTVDGEEYKNFLKAVKGRMERRLEELPEVDRAQLNQLEKEYTHELGSLDLELQKIEIIPSWHNWALGPIVEMQIKKNMEIYGCAAREIKDYEQQFTEWSDLINTYNARTALKIRSNRINNTLNGKHNAALLLGTRYHEDGSVHMYAGQPVKLPLEVIKQISGHVPAVSERDIVKHGRWIYSLGGRTYYADKDSYEIGSLSVPITNIKKEKRELHKKRGITGIYEGDLAWVKLGETSNPSDELLRTKSELARILGNHDYYKDVHSIGSTQFGKTKHWNIELPLRNVPYQKNGKPLYGPSLYYFDEKGWEDTKKKYRKQQVL